MIINSLKIYGFGKLTDVEINLSEGINVIEGRNEAGKSTIMAFIRGVLFGFASRRNPHERYEPIDGGRFGGVLFLSDENGEEYVIERIFTLKTAGDVAITLPSGEQAGEEKLPLIIGKINENVFRQVFSFGLMELQQIELLSDDQINDFIYHVGTGSVNQILEMKKEIEKKKGDLFLTSGRKPAINQLLKTLDEVAEEIRELENEADKYANYQNEVDILEQQIGKHEEQLRELEQKLVVEEKHEKLYKPYIDLKKIELALENYPDNFAFPEDGLRRIEDAQHQLSKFKVNESELNKRIDFLKNQIIDLKEDETLSNQSSQIKYLQSQLVLYIESLKNEQSYLGQIKLVDDKISEDLSLIGRGYNENTIKDFEITIQDKDKLQNYYNQLADQKLGIDELIREVERLDQLEEETLNAISSLKKESEITNEADVLVAEFPDIRHNWAKLNQNKLEQRHKEEQLILFKEQLATKVSPLSIGNFLILLFVFAAAGLIFFYSNSLFIAGVVTLIGFAVIVIYNLVRNAEIKRKNQSIKNKISRETEQLNLIIEGESVLLKNLEIALRKLGVTEIDEATIYRLEQNYNLELSKSLMRIGEHKRIIDFEKELKDIKSKRMRITERRDKNVEQHSILTSELNNWLESKGLPTGINYNALSSLIVTIERIKESIGRKENLANELEATRKFLGDYRASGAQLTDAAKLPDNKALEQHINDISERLATYNDNYTQNKNNQYQINEKVIAMQQNTKEIQLLESTIEELLSHAQVTGIEEFYSTANKFKQFSELMQRKQQIELSIKISTSTETEYNDLIRALDQVDYDELTKEIEILLKEKSRLSNLIKEDSVELGSLQSYIKAIESNTRISELKNEYEQERAELQRMVKDWLGYAYSEKLLEQTMKLYEEEKQPNILRIASDLFSKMTGNQYTKLITPIGSNKLRVIRADDRQFDPQSLSRGTVEQLFLAIRYALVKEYSQQYRLPVMLDDVFVNFDENRLASAVEIVMELAVEHQVIIFTCHPELTKRLKNADKSVYNTKLA